MSLEEARAWPDLMGIVEERVKPYRENLKENSSTISSFKRYWWRHGNPRSESYRVNRRRKRCLVSARVSKHLMFSFQPTDRLFSEQLYVFSLDTYTAFAVLQSRVHEVWARLLSSTMGEAGLRYGLRNCFYTFPFPAKDIRESISVAEAIGERVYEARALFMNESNMGLTDTYNLIKDPECSDKSILHLRLLHESMDRAIIDAYRWGDIEVPVYCPQNPEEEGEVEKFKDEILDRLHVLNMKRAEENN